MSTRFLSLHFRPVSDAVDFENAIKTSRYTGDHILDQGTGGAMQRTVLAVIRRALDKDMTIFKLDGHIRRERYAPAFPSVQ